MTPIYFSSLGNVSPKTISVNLDQDKMGQSVNPVNVIQSAKDLSIFSRGNKLPYIAAVHCYARRRTKALLSLSQVQITPETKRRMRRRHLVTKSISVASAHMETSPIQSELQFER